MATDTKPAEKRIAVENLDFGAKTAKRVAWESWEFTVVGPHQVRVTNASYGFLKDDHSYTVGVDLRNGLASPAECECPADIHHDQDCKHKVALATVGGPTVLNAAVEAEASRDNKELKADGGCECDSDELPCFECYNTGRRDLPE